MVWPGARPNSCPGNCAAGQGTEAAEARNPKLLSVIPSDCMSAIFSCLSLTFFLWRALRRMALFVKFIGAPEGGGGRAGAYGEGDNKDISCRTGARTGSMLEAGSLERD